MLYFVFLLSSALVFFSPQLPSISILSRDPNLSRRPPETQAHSLWCREIYSTKGVFFGTHKSMSFDGSRVKYFWA